MYRRSFLKSYLKSFRRSFCRSTAGGTAEGTVGADSSSVAGNSIAAAWPSRIPFRCFHPLCLSFPFTSPHLRRDMLSFSSMGLKR